MKTKTPLTDAIYPQEPAVICTGTALRADKERLDYIERNVDFVSWRFYGKPQSWDLRGTIDAKRKEAQP